jgi:hypothetical protein
LAKKCEQIWRPAQLAFWEKQLLVQRRLAKDEELFALSDQRSGVNADLDQAFDQALMHLLGTTGMLLQPRPTEAQVFFSQPGIFVDLPEPVEFARISISYDGFDVLYACSSDESRWLIFPVNGQDEFSRSGKLTITFNLDIGADYPRLRYGSLPSESVELPLQAEE